MRSIWLAAIRASGPFPGLAKSTILYDRCFLQLVQAVDVADAREEIQLGSFFELETVDVKPCRAPFRKHASDLLQASV